MVNRPANAEPRSKPIRILLAEDHVTVREGLRLLIDAQDDMEVVAEAGDGRSAIERAREFSPDVVVLDLTMPVLTGLAAARGVRTVSPQTAIVALTRHNDPAYVQEVTAAGAAGYVLKQSPSAELLRAIRAAASGTPHLDPALPRSEPADGRRRSSTPRVTERELEVLHMVAAGHTNREIAAALEISVKTVEVHKANAMRKLGLQGRADVVRYAVLSGWLREPSGD
jgi:DNA-binding NarL/FixJ family response regulator